MQPCSFCQKPATHRQTPDRTENGLCKELAFCCCTLLQGFASLRPQRGRPRWLAKNKPEQWKLKSNEITSESCVLLKYLQCCSSEDGWLFPFPTAESTSSYLDFTTLFLKNGQGIARQEMQQVHDPLQRQDTFSISRFPAGFFGDCKASSWSRSG